MKTVQFDIDSANGNRLRIFANNFASAAELVSYCKSRKCKRGMDDTDYFNGASADNGWSGFSTSEELLSLIENGLNDRTIIDEVGKYAKTASVKDEEKLSKKFMDVAGGAVNVPAYLTGVPTCMHSIRRQKIKSRIVKIGIFCEVLGGVSAERYREAGEIMAKTVAKLEKAGYRIRMRAIDAYEDSGYDSRAHSRFDGRHDVWVLTHMIKKENEPMNYRRILFPLTSAAYCRGVGFGWNSVNDNPSRGMGGLVASLFDDDSERAVMFAKATGEDDYIIFSHTEIIRYIREYGVKKAQEIVDAKVMSLC